MIFPKIYCKIRQVTNFQNWQQESCDLFIYGEQSWQNEPKFYLNAPNFWKRFSDKIEIDGLGKAFVKSFRKRYTIWPVSQRSEFSHCFRH